MIWGRYDGGMLDTILNNPHYIMYAMIIVFVVVVIVLIIVAVSNARTPNSYEPMPRDRSAGADTRSGRFAGKPPTADDRADK